LMDLFAKEMGKEAKPDAAEEGKEVKTEPEFGEAEEPVARIVSNAITKDAQLKGSSISVTYDGDTVTLSGTVKSVALKNRAATVAKSALAAQKVTATVKNTLLVRAGK
jgi:osmotically-inducible protein OsmY